MTAMFSKGDIEKYFIAEKQESLLFCIVGIGAVLLSLIFFFNVKKHFYTGAAIPLLALGILMFIAGLIVYKRSDGDRIRNVYAYDMNPGELKEKELPRMKTVMRNFVVYRYTEIILLLAGSVIYGYFIRDLTNDFWRGLGMALALLALVALIADYFAEKRGRSYTKGIESFIAATH
jgi:predicted membrane channel-forming protein YqfA (hemolysin III family)